MPVITDGVCSWPALDYIIYVSIHIWKMVFWGMYLSKQSVKGFANKSLD